jgi:hypothetical protein
MTSFGATYICDLTSDGFYSKTNCRIPEQVYHTIDSLMTMLIDDSKFLQIYYKGRCEERVITQRRYNFNERAEEKKKYRESKCGIVGRFRGKS